MDSRSSPALTVVPRIEADRPHPRPHHRPASWRGNTRPRAGRPEAVRDAFETRRASRPWVARAASLFALVLATLAASDLMIDAPPLRWASWIAAVALCGFAALVALAMAEPAGEDQRRRWHLQAVASAALMFMLMARGADGASADLSWLIVVLGVAAVLVGMATTYRDGLRTPVGALCLALDAVIVGFTVALCALALSAPGERSSTAAAMLGAFAAAAYAVAVATRASVRADPRGSDAYLLGAVLVLCVQMAGDAGRQLGVGGAGVLAVPGVALYAALCLARSAWLGRRVVQPLGGADPMPETRLRLVPAAAAAATIVVLSSAAVSHTATRTGFFGVIGLFGLIVGRLLITLLENRQLLQRLDRSGLFEEKLRDVGGALVTALDRKNTLALVCHAAQLALGADAVLLWMLDSATDELEAVEVLSSKRESLLHRRLPLNDPVALSARVARSGAAEIVHNVPSANLSHGFYNVLLRAQTLLAVPVMQVGRVQGVLVCVDAKSPTAYGVRDLAKAELLASQVAVALDNAYQHALQRRRLEELTALYQFAQSAHAAHSGTEIVGQLLPIVKERLNFSSATIWLRDQVTGTLRLAAADQPTGVRRLRPSALAMQAFVTGEPARAGLGWAASEDETEPPSGQETQATGQREQASELAVPMVLKRRVVGVVDLESPTADAFSSTEERLVVALANHAALAVDNLHLLEETRKVEALKELDRMKTELLSTVSHELRTPLGSIKGYATTLLTHGNKLPKDEQREFLEIIDSEADRLRELIENLLDMSRLEAGVLRIDREPTRLGRLAREVVRKVQLAARRHELAVEWPSDDPLVNADEKRIYQVLQNLLTNAIKYSPDGGRITLEAIIERRELVVSVSDQGLGMPPTELEKIFDRFHRVGGEVSRRIGGTGLGLAICKGLVEAHGGRIWADSKGEGTGSTFSFTLPLLPHSGDTVVPAPLSSSPSKGAYDHQEANRSRR